MANCSRIKRASIPPKRNQIKAVTPYKVPIFLWSTVVTQDQMVPNKPEYFEFKQRQEGSFRNREFRNQINDEKVKILNSEKNFYEIKFKNIGGLITPLIIEWTYEDGSKEIEKIPAEIWRANENEVTKVFVKNKIVNNIMLDPFLETADTDVSDNNFPRLILKSKFDKFKN